jgi:hypothetical protein
VTDPPPRILFIGGVGRSGSTLLDLMLGQVPGVVAVGEVSYLWGRDDADLCGCGESFGGCPFWVAVGEAAFGGWGAVDRARLARIRLSIDRNRRIPSLASRRARSPDEARYADAYRAVYRAVATVSGAQVVVDSTKHPSTAFLLRSFGDLDLRIVHLVRDPRGVAYSWTKEVSRPGIAGGAMMDRYPAWKMAGRWVAYNSAFHLLRRIGVPTMRVRYEDLVRDPSATLERIARLLGVPTPGFPFLDGTSLSLAEEHTIAGNPVRFDRGPIQLRRDDAWQTRMPAKQRLAVSAISLPLRLVYGYTAG